MSDANTIDSLKISVETTSDKASGSLDELAANLASFANSIKDMDLGKVASGFDVLAQGIASVGVAMQGIDASALEKVADAYDKIAGKTINAPSVDKPKITQSNPEKPDIAPELDIEPQIEDVNKLQGALSALQDKFKATFTPKGRAAAKNEEIQSLIDKVKEYKQTISDMNSGKTPFDLKEYKEASEGLEKASASLSKLKGEAEGATSPLKRVVALLEKTGVAALGLKAVSAPFKLFEKLVHHGAEGLKEFAEKTKHAGLRFTEFGKKIGQRFTFTLLRKAINAVINSLKAGIDALAQFDGAISNTFDKNLGNHLAGLKAFGYQLVAAFAPIYNAIAPAVSYLIGLLNTLAQAMAQLFSGLTGSSTWVKSVAASADYSETLKKNTGGAAKNAKEMKKQLAGFDRLNNLTSNDDSGKGGGGGGNAAPLEPKFTETDISPEMEKLIKKIKQAWKKADFTELGTIFGKKVKKALKAIPWDFIQEIAEKVGKSFATFLNGFIETKGLGKEVGKAIGEAINTYVQLIDGFFANLHFENLGKFVGDAFNGLADAVNWEAIGEGWATKLNALFDFLKGIAEEWDASAMGKAMASAIVAAIEEIDWGENGKSLAMFLNDLFECLDSFLTDIPWDEIGEGIAEDINGFFGEFNWEQGGKTIADFVNAMFDFVSGLVTKTDWKKIGGSIVEAITGFFGNIKWEKIGKTLSGFISGIFDFFAGAIEKVNWQTLPQDIIDAITDFFSSVDGEDITNSIFEFLGSALGAVAGLLKGTWDAIVKIGKAIKDAFVEWFTDNAFNEEGEFVIEGLLNGILDAVKNIGNWIYTNIFQPFLKGIHDAFKISSPSKVMEDQGGFIIDGLFEGISAGIDAIIGIFTDLKDTIVKKVEELGKGVKKKWDNIKSKTTKTVESIKTKVTDDFNKIKTNASSAMEKVNSVVKEKWNAVKSKLSENKFVQKVSAAFSNVKKYVSNGVSKAYTKTKDKWDAIKSKLEEQGFVATVKDAFDGIKGNIYTNMNNAAKKVKNKWNSISKKLKEDGFKKTAMDAFNSIGSTILTVMETAWTTVSNIWGKIKGLFDKGLKTDVTVNTNGNTNKKAKGGAFFNGAWHDFGLYAAGGAPNYGTAFIAGEAGAEVVGHVNGRTEVLNESQLASVMYDSVSGAMAQQNALLREEISYLKKIASKDVTISSRDVFNAVRSESTDYKRRTGRLAFGV